MRLRALLLVSVAGLVACAPDYLDLGYDRGGTSTGGAAGSSGTLCKPGETRECYTGPDGTKGQGICKAGTQTCQDDGASFGDCKGEVTPKAEDCSTPQDEDCDGLAPSCEGMCLWSMAFGDAAHQEGSSIAVDPSGNLILAGVFAGTVNFGGGPVTAPTGDLFLAKFGNGGSHQWSKAFGSPSSLTAPAVALDSAGSAYMDGAFQGSVDFGSGQLVSKGGWDIFATRQDANGDTGWSLAAGDAGYQATKNVVVDKDGNCILAGEFSGAINFGAAPLMSAGALDAFLAKLDSQGKHVWSARFGGTDNQLARALAVDKAGNVIVAGMFKDAIDLGGGPLANKGDFDIFIGKLSPDGNHIWSRSFGNSDAQTVYDVTVSPDGDVVITGATAGPLDLGGGPLTNDHPLNIFGAKLHGADGSHAWSKAFGDASNQAPTRVAVDSSGNVVFVGGFAGTVDFGGGPLASLGDDVFVAKLTADGTHVWSKRFGDPDNQSKTQWATSVAIDGGGNIFLTGYFEGKINFGCGVLTSAGDTDVFVARLSP